MGTNFRRRWIGTRETNESLSTVLKFLMEVLEWEKAKMQIANVLSKKEPALRPPVKGFKRSYIHSARSPYHNTRDKSWLFRTAPIPTKDESFFKSIVKNGIGRSHQAAILSLQNVSLPENLNIIQRLRGIDK